mmetsp:Transcript_27961/g.24634  ORF Transcript_27961/g.24634 Transcript_27961/m.24634 type:complete len:202 (+) Transcript_27961:1579-2184(+)
MSFLSYDPNSKVFLEDDLGVVVLELGVDGTTTVLCFLLMLLSKDLSWDLLSLLAGLSKLGVFLVEPAFDLGVVCPPLIVVFVVKLILLPEEAMGVLALSSETCLAEVSVFLLVSPTSTLLFNSERLPRVGSLRVLLDPLLPRGAGLFLWRLDSVAFFLRPGLAKLLEVSTFWWLVLILGAPSTSISPAYLATTGTKSFCTV